MANTKITYQGNGSTKTFSFPFPYIRAEDVNVTLNNEPISFAFASANSVELGVTPRIDDLVTIFRVTSLDTRLVDYQDGAVLTEEELDLDSKQAFYLCQEIAENYSDLINGALVQLATDNGIVINDPEDILDTLIIDILNSELAAELQARISDIDNNAQGVLINTGLINQEIILRTKGDLTLQQQVNALAGSVVAEIYVQPTPPVPGEDGVPDPIPDNARWYDSDDDNAPYIWQGEDLQDTLYKWTATGNPNEWYLELDIGGDPVVSLPAEILESGVGYMTDGTQPLAAGEWAYGTNGGALGFSTIIVRLTDNADPNSKPAEFLKAYDWLDLSDPRIGANEAAITALDVRLVTAEGDIISEAAALDALDVTVTNNGATITSNVSRLTDLESTVDDPLTGVNANATALDSLDTRVTASEGDITANASDISNLQVTVNDPSTGVAANATAINVLDARVTSNDGDIASTASDVSALNADITDPSTGLTAIASQAAAALVSAASANDGVSANATSISNLTVDVDGNTATVATQAAALGVVQGDVVALEARYGVSLNVNGYITGFEQFNNGSSGTFQILADDFYIVDPASGGQNPIIPFAVTGGVTYMQNVVIDGDLLVNGTVTLNALDVASLSALNLTIGTTGWIRGGQTSYATGTGFFLGYEGGTYRFSIGDSTNFIRWDGTELLVKGNIRLGEFILSNDVIDSANTERDTGLNPSSTWVAVKRFAIGKSGQVRLKWEQRLTNSSGGIVLNGTYRVLRNGVSIATGSIISTSWLPISRDIFLTDTTTELELQIKAGEYNPTDPLPSASRVRNCTITGFDRGTTYATLD